MAKYEPEVGILRFVCIPAATDDVMLIVAQVELEGGLIVFAFLTKKFGLKILVLSLNADEFVGFVFKDVKN
jgi:hypothetical protein